MNSACCPSSWKQRGEAEIQRQARGAACKESRSVKLRQKRCSVKPNLCKTGTTPEAAQNVQRRISRYSGPDDGSQGLPGGGACCDAKWRRYWCKGGACNCGGDAEWRRNAGGAFGGGGVQGRNLLGSGGGGHLGGGGLRPLVVVVCGSSTISKDLVDIGLNTGRIGAIGNQSPVVGSTGSFSSGGKMLPSPAGGSTSSILNSWG